jgi:hypothetical protein
MLYLAIKLTGESNLLITHYSLLIGQDCGGISGSAVTHAYHKVRDRIKIDNQLANSISVIETLVNSEFQT